ncbi:hypothetical protein N657DRAFT_26955 [Parathielavia appendiculata]|uniref:Uncharacterized protein n=1 Tax=Parathielavia appendiculata TaxID=2587402 RepID=A0AAN6U9C0_9PEZI|nr:hypothetical protein N657DRAFT_26955 [Parathielavia appendiculata]
MVPAMLSSVRCPSKSARLLLFGSRTCRPSCVSATTCPSCSWSVCECFCSAGVLESSIIVLCRVVLVSVRREGKGRCGGERLSSCIRGIVGALSGAETGQVVWDGARFVVNEINYQGGTHDIHILVRLGSRYRYNLASPIVPANAMRKDLWRGGCVERTGVVTHERYVLYFNLQVTTSRTLKLTECLSRSTGRADDGADAGRYSDCN